MIPKTGMGAPDVQLTRQLGHKRVKFGALRESPFARFIRVSLALPGRSRMLPPFNSTVCGFRPYSGLAGKE